MTAVPTEPVVLHPIQVDELRHLLEGVLGWLADGDPDAHHDLALHLADIAAREGGPLAGADGDTLGLFESFLDVYTATILDPEP